MADVQNPSPTSDQIEARETEAHLQSRQDSLQVQKIEININCQVQSAPSTISGTEEKTKHVINKLCLHERFHGLFIQRFSDNFARVCLVSENKETAARFLAFLSLGNLLHLMNEEVKNHFEGESDEFFDSVDLNYFERKEVSREVLDSMKKAAVELRAQSESECRTELGTSRKRPGSVATERESVTAKRHAPSEEDPTSCSYTQTGRIEGNHGEERYDRLLQRSFSLEELLENALTLEDVIAFIHNNSFADVCDVMKDEFDNPLALQIGYMIQYHKALVMEKEIARASEVVEKLVKLMKDKVPVICPDRLLVFAKRIYRRKQYMEAALFYELSASFYGSEKSTVNSADGIADSVKGLRRVSKSLVKLNEDAHKAIIKDYIIPIMRAMVEKVRNTTYKHRVPWCLHYIEVTMCLVKDWEARETIILETMDLMRESNDGDRDEKQLYGHLLCNLGQNYEKKSDPKQAHNYYQRAFYVYKMATDITCEQRHEYHKDVQENLDRVSKFLPRED